jgi:hypothetical protein
MVKSNAFIGFPEGMLRDKQIRLPVLANEPGWFALNKFSGLLGQAHPRYAGRPNITNAIRSQAEAGKGELDRLGISNCYYMCGPEFDIPGPIVFAKEKSTANLLKNAYGSDQIKLTYRFLTEAKISGAELSCNLPIAQHAEKSLALVSRKSGKKSATHFRRIMGSQSLSLWEAVTTHPRLDQVRLHAAELGIPVMGDSLYGRVLTHLESSRSRSLSRSTPRFRGLAMLLFEVDLSRILPGNSKICVEPSKQFSAFLRKFNLLEAE